MKEWRIQLPLHRDEIEMLTAGDYVYLTGELYVARDAAHKRLLECIERGEEIPISLSGEMVYYMGPSPAREGQVIGSAGPTTAGRMDRYTPVLLEKGLLGMIGKGKRSPQVINAMMEHKAVYFGAVGGAGALLSKCIKHYEMVCYEDLGTEALAKIRVEDFPLVVLIDSQGRDLYAQVNKI